MKRIRIISTLFVMLVCAVLAQAQSERTFVSSHGTDSSDCSSSDLPCRSFSFALAKTNAGGEVIALDSGIYNDTNIGISKSVTLTAAPGAHVELSAPNDAAQITVSATTSDVVVLRNLYLSRQTGVAGSGIKVNQVGMLHIENCVVSGFNVGIAFILSASAQAFIQDTLVRNCLSSGIFVTSNAGVIKVSIDHCRLLNNGMFPGYNGLDVASHARVTVRDSVASGNRGAGFAVAGGDLNLENCEASNNDTGVFVIPLTSSELGTATVSNCIVTNNHSFGFQQSNGGVLQSLGNNIVRRNGTNTSGTITVISGT